MTDQELVDLAREAARKAYAPYSNFHVGCAIESVDGEVVTGANMENACYRLGVCAEQSALTAAQHRFGLDKVARISVSGGEGDMNDTLWRCDQIRAGQLYNRVMFDTKEEAEQFMNRMRQMEPDQMISIEAVDASKVWN